MDTFTLSPMDEARFGVRTGKALLRSIDSLKTAMEQAKTESVALMILRVPTEAHRVSQAVEAEGGRLMDTLCYFEHALECSPTLRHAQSRCARPNWRLAVPHDAAEVEALTRRAFADYDGHYHQDPRLDPKAVAEVYPSWARACCQSASEVEPVILGDCDGRLVAYAALRRPALDALDVALLAVDPAERGRGHASTLLTYLVESARTWRVRRLCYSTQVTNIAMQRLLTAAGFVPTSSVYTFHLWNSFR